MLVAWARGPRPAQAAGAFSDWAAVVVSGDDRAHSGGPSEAFDNARRDVARELVDIGFSAANMHQFSIQPERYPDEHLMVSDPDLIAGKLADLADAAHGGCLVYFTSHGSPDGVVVGLNILSPAGLSLMVDGACGDRPTVVIISACFSGVFVPPLSRPNRMVLTAARADRASFGCGQTDRYPYFDACMIETLPAANDFADLGRRVQGCVAAREKATGMTPPSEPQLFVGAELKPVIAFYPFTHAVAGGPDLSHTRSTP
ncbi:MAG TPA: C13 family peptidase [Caulobacteraceae bacterium]